MVAGRCVVNLPTATGVRTHRRFPKKLKTARASEDAASRFSDLLLLSTQSLIKQTVSSAGHRRAERVQRARARRRKAQE